MHFRNQKYLLLSFCLSVLNTYGQGNNFPASQIHLITLESTSENFKVSNIKYLTHFNEGNYNNQPFFLSKNRILISSNLEDDYIDIVELNLLDERVSYFTKTNLISEFSPKLTPYQRHISTVRIEEDGTTQSLWLYPLDKSNYGRRLLTNLSNVGYYEWLDDKNIAIFEVGDPNYLKVFNIDSGNSQNIATNIGRCIKRIDSNSFYFVSKAGDDYLYLKKYDLSEQRSQIVTEIGSEDFDVDANGNIFSIVNDVLLVFGSHLNAKWQPVLNLIDLGIHNANRITIYGNQIAIVSETK